MKIASLNGAAESGGAARAAMRLHRALLLEGIDSVFFARYMSAADATVAPAQDNNQFRRLMNLTSRYLDGLPRILYGQYDGTKWTTNWLKGGAIPVANSFRYDLVHLHWVGAGLVSIGDVRRFQKPVIWTLHDMWPFTGGCHYSQGCTRYEYGCGTCPILGSTQRYDLSRFTFGLKSRAWRHTDITFVAPSRWLADLASSSLLGQGRRVEVIANGVDVDLFRPHEKYAARKALGLPLNRQLILIANESLGTDPRKGFSLLRGALADVGQDERYQGVDLIAMGADPTGTALSTGIPVHALGFLTAEETMSLVYASADLFVTPSTEENLSNTVLEALACGTPCVAFDIGGMPDMIIDGVNGELVPVVDARALRESIARMLSDGERLSRMATNARRTAEERFDVRHSARAHIELYEDVLHAAQT